MSPIGDDMDVVENVHGVVDGGREASSFIIPLDAPPLVAYGQSDPSVHYCWMNKSCQGMREQFMEFENVLLHVLHNQRAF